MPGSVGYPGESDEPGACGGRTSTGRLAAFVYEAIVLRLPREGNAFERMRRYVPALIPVFMGALRGANNMAMALEARGFGMGARPTPLGDYQMRSADAVALGFLAVLAAAYFMIYWSGYGIIAAQ